MAAVTAAAVMALREKTGLPMMECKKALINSLGDMDKAVEEMRKAGQAKADKKSSRIAAEGVVYYHNDDNIAMLIEINSETDFVAKSDDFLDYVKQTCELFSTAKLSLIHI